MVVPDAALAALPGPAAMLAEIEEIVGRGIRRPGYPADQWVEGHIGRRFAALGLERVRREPVEVPYWEGRSASITVDGTDVGDLDAFPTPFCRPGEVAAELVAWDAAEPERMAGRIVVYDLTLLEAPGSFPVLRRRHDQVDDPAVAAAQEAGWAFDPAGSLDTDRHHLPFPIEMQQTMEPAVAAGAVGFVGVLRNYPGGGNRYYVPYDAVDRPIPAAYVGAAVGDRLLAAVAGGPVTARLAVDADRATTTSHNVVGELAGADEDWVVVGTHHDAPWASAVEDASGIAMVLAQAEAWAAVPAGDRPHRLVFTANAGHMAHGAGTQAFLDAHRADLDRIVLELHLEHAAREAPEVDGVPTAVDVPVPRWWFTTEAAPLEAVVWEAIVAEGLDRSLLMTPTALAPFPTTDGGFFHLEGVPLVNYLTAPWYLFDEADTVDKIHVPSLGGVSRAAARIVAATAGVSPTTWRRAARS